MAKGRLYDAFVNAGFKTNADRLYSFTNGVPSQKLGAHILRHESGKEATSQSTILKAAQGICRFIDEKNIPVSRGTGHVLDEVENFIKEYTPQTN